MNKIYDNGDQFIGKRKNIIEYIKKALKEKVIDEETYEELEEELQDIDDETIVMVDYSFGMGLYIRTWKESEVLE